MKCAIKVNIANPTAAQRRRASTIVEIVPITNVQKSADVFLRIVDETSTNRRHVEKSG